jgi:hypothetical protein
LVLVVVGRVGPKLHRLPLPKLGRAVAAPVCLILCTMLPTWVARKPTA